MTAAPNNHLPIQIQQKKLEKKMWNRLKFNNKDTGTTSYAAICDNSEWLKPLTIFAKRSIWRRSGVLIDKFEHYFTPFSRFSQYVSVSGG